MVQITLEIPDYIEKEARSAAKRTGRRVEDILQEWLTRSLHETPVEALTDELVLELSRLELSSDEQNALSDLLELNREGQLDATNRLRLDELMNRYSQGMIRKAEATKIAVQRGLIAPLGE